MRQMQFRLSLSGKDSGTDRAGCRQPELFAQEEDRAGLTPVGWGIRTARGVVLARSCEAWTWQSGRQVTPEGERAVRATPRLGPLRGGERDTGEEE